MNLFIESIIYFLLIMGAVAFGGVLPYWKRLNSTPLPLFLSLSAGLMLGSSFIHLIPESFALIGSKASFYVLSGLLFLYLFEKFITVHICEANECEVHHLGISAFIGLFLHGITDGVALGVGLLSPKLGLVVFIAIFAHKALEAFSLTSILLHERKAKSKVILANAALLCSMPVGATLTFLLISQGGVFTITENAGVALAFSAGTFLHISLSDLLPEVHKHSNLRNRSVFFFILGLSIMTILAKVL